MRIVGAVGLEILCRKSGSEMHGMPKSGTEESNVGYNGPTIAVR